MSAASVSRTQIACLARQESFGRTNDTHRRVLLHYRCDRFVGRGIDNDDLETAIEALRHKSTKAAAQLPGMVPAGN